ncbi:hypothetical protein BSR28_06675 [Boudabousia liubingyangii]|uniref:DUF3027 domain-containing protein n=1 Tax=Boudabousia liubingyangii TaxID=1921764 RepID=UPI00093E35AA|nr:DUF3027 domain-containing protein [Boudabousia liubingyangii]OKL47084.1 hypothetical protein BSR28_06675 [Boudabousia liubingyangii]
MTSEKTTAAGGNKTKPRKDAKLAQAVDLAQEAAQSVARPGHVGDHLGVEVDGPMLLTHYFECLHPGYVGWAWAVTVTRVPRSSQVTVCEVEMLPYQNALLAPPWVPWEERLQPADVPRGEMVPFIAHDERLVTGEERAKEADIEPGDEIRQALDRPRVLSAESLNRVGERWTKSLRTARATKRYPQSCETCAFMIKLTGPVGKNFGVCGNEYALDDGKVVPNTYSCGAHSETDADRTESPWEIEPLRLNDLNLEVLDPAEFWSE